MDLVGSDVVEDAVPPRPRASLRLGAGGETSALPAIGAVEIVRLLDGHSVEAVLRAPPYAFLPATPAAVLVAQASSVASCARLFVVAPGSAPLAVLLRSGRIDVRGALGPVFGSGTSGRLFGTLFGPLSDFLSATLPRFRPLETRIFPGVLPVSEYVLQRR